MSGRLLSNIHIVVSRLKQATQAFDKRRQASCSNKGGAKGRMRALQHARLRIESQSICDV